MIHTRSSYFHSNLKMCGALTIHIFDVITGQLLRTLSKSNTIVEGAQDIVRSLLTQRSLGAGGDPIDPYEYSWGSMRFGTNGSPTLITQGDLFAEVTTARKELQDVQKVNGAIGEVTLTTTLENDDANSTTLREAGIFTRGSGLWSAGVGGSLKMFSRQAHAPLEKTSALRFEYAWVFQFTT